MNKRFYLIIKRYDIYDEGFIIIDKDVYYP
jgi:hypothetical protein